MPAPEYEDPEDYFYQVLGRLEKGSREYGDSAMNRPVSAIAHEMSEEAEDISGWGYWLWRRCIRLRKQAIALEREIKALEAERDALKEAVAQAKH